MIQFDDVLGRARSAELFYGVVKHHPNLICLKVNKGQLSADDAKAIGKILADFKFIRELDISNT